MTYRNIGLALAACGLAGCAGSPAPQGVAGLTEPQVSQQLQEPPPGADPDSCWGKDVTPAVVESVREQVMLQPAQIHSDGTIQAPAVYKTENRLKIVQERREVWFETPCPQDLTAERVASVQRALKARGYYKGPVNGMMDARTRRAIRKYQAPQGLNSGILSLAAMRKLGLEAYERTEDPQDT